MVRALVRFLAGTVLQTSSGYRCQFVLRCGRRSCFGGGVERNCCSTLAGLCNYIVGRRLLEFVLEFDLWFETIDWFIGVMSCGWVFGPRRKCFCWRWLKNSTLSVIHFNRLQVLFLSDMFHYFIFNIWSTECWLWDWTGSGGVSWLDARSRIASIMYFGADVCCDWLARLTFVSFTRS